MVIIVFAVCMIIIFNLLEVMVCLTYVNVPSMSKPKQGNSLAKIKKME